MTTQAPTEIIYVFDAYCGWCYGFGPTMHQLHEALRDRVTFRVISGGLFTGARSQPIRNYPHIPGANQRIAAETGVSFGAPYEALLREGSFVLDSAAAATGLAALRAQAPDRAVEFAEAVQAAFYREGRNLSDVATYEAIAREHGLEASRVAAFIQGPEGHAAMRKDFEEVQALGVSGYPTLLLRQGDTITQLPTFEVPAAVLQGLIESKVAGQHA